MYINTNVVSSTFCNSLNGPNKERRENVNQIELQHQIKSNKSKWQNTRQKFVSKPVLLLTIYSDKANGIYQHACNLIMFQCQINAGIQWNDSLKITHSVETGTGTM